MLIVAIVTGVLVVAAWQGLRQLRPAAADPDVQVFTVTRRSFPVILQEKGELKAANQIDVRCELQGKATIIKLVEEGRAVRKGELLVELASDEIDEKVREAESREILARAAYDAGEKELQILKERNLNEIRKVQVKHSLAQQALSRYREGDSVQLRQEKQLALEEAKYLLTRSEESLKDSEELYQQGFVTRIDLQNDRATVYQNRIKLRNAELALQVLQHFTVPMELQQKQSDVDDGIAELECKKKEAQASEEKLAAEVNAKKSDHRIAGEKLARLQDQKKKTLIPAPADGMVVYFKEDWWSESRVIKAGAQVYEQQILIQLPDTSSMKVKFRVHEAKAEKLKAGLPAMVQIEGMAGRQFPGRVSKVAVLADSKEHWFNPNVKEYETEVLLDGTFTELKPGVTAQVQVKVTDLQDVLAVPVQAVFGKGRKYFVFASEGGLHPVEVKIGLASTELIEIKEGLRGGERVSLAVPEEAKLSIADDGADIRTTRWSQTTQPATQPSSPASAEKTTQPASSSPAASPTTRRTRQEGHKPAADHSGATRAGNSTAPAAPTG